MISEVDSSKTVIGEFTKHNHKDLDSKEHKLIKKKILCKCKYLKLGKSVGNTYLCEHYNLAVCYPNIAKEWDYSKNLSKPEDYSPKSNKIFWWKCLEPDTCGCHYWETSANNRTKEKGTGCPYCSGREACCHNNLLLKAPDLCNEWDYSKNIKGPDKYLVSSGKRVWWICNNPEACECHTYEARIIDKSSGKYGCLYCSKQRLCPHNNLLAKHPDICKEWHYELNDQGPETYHRGSNYKVWWKCLANNDHIWRAKICNRTCSGTGCPICKESKEKNIQLRYLTL